MNDGCPPPTGTNAVAPRSWQALHPPGSVSTAANDRDVAGAVDAAPTSHHDHFFWLGLATLSYLPSTVFPTGLSNQGLPIGWQIIGPEYRGRTTLEVARLAAQELGGFQLPPRFGA